MRIVLAAAFALVLTSQARAQFPPNGAERMRQDQAIRHSEQLGLDLNTAENRARADQAMREMRAQDERAARAQARIKRQVAAKSAAEYRDIHIPDARLAKSNERVRAIAHKRR